VRLRGLLGGQEGAVNIRITSHVHTLRYCPKALKATGILLRLHE
jgi:hypothetical protein